MTANISIKLNDGQAFVFGGVETFNLSPHTLKLLPRGTLSQWTLIKTRDIKEILIKPMAQDPVDWEDATKRFEGV